MSIYLVGDFRSIAKFRSESVLDNPLDGGTGVSSSSLKWLGTSKRA